MVCWLDIRAERLRDSQLLEEKFRGGPQIRRKVGEEWKREGKVFILFILINPYVRNTYLLQIN